jgi:hypothetical protein
MFQVRKATVTHDTHSNAGWHTSYLDMLVVTLRPIWEWNRPRPPPFQFTTSNHPLASPLQRPNVKAIKMYGGLEVCLHTFLASALDRFKSQGKRHQYPLERRVGGPRSQCRRRVEDRNKILFCPCRELNRGRPAHSLISKPTELTWLLCLSCTMWLNNLGT